MELMNRLSTAEEKRLIDETLGGLPFPALVKGYSVKFDQDESGDPAVWINFLVQADDDVGLPKAKLTNLTKFKNKVVQALLEKHIQSWPFVRLMSA